MKKLIVLGFLLMLCHSFAQTTTMTNSELMRNIDNNYDNVKNSPDLEPNPKPERFGYELKDRINNKFVFTSKLNKNSIYKKLIKLLNSEDIFKNNKIIYEDADDLIIEREVNKNFSYFIGNGSYWRESTMRIKIKIKDNAYQVELVNFAIGEKGILHNYSYIIDYIYRHYEPNVVGVYYQKLAQRDYNEFFIMFNENLQKLSDKINETNDF